MRGMSEVATLTLAELAEELRRSFHADQLSELELRRLHRRWEEFAGDQARVAGQGTMFQPENAEHVVAGLQWWEERQQGRTETVRPITLGDRAAMLFSSERTLAIAPEPRLYNPAELVGRWDLLAAGRRGAAERAAERPVDPPRHWRLGAEGGFHDSAAPERDGWLWRVHRGAFAEIWLGPGRHAAEQRWWIRRRDGEEIELCPPGGAIDHYRCRRVTP